MKRKNIKEKIKEYFFVHPMSKLRVRQIEKVLKLSFPSVIRYCKELEEEGILKTLKTVNVVFYTADRINKKFILEKKLFNIKQISKSGIVDHIRKELHNPPIVLFGSYSKGEDTEKSDVDLYIETPSKKKIKIDVFERFLNRKIQTFRHKNIKEVPNHHLANNIVNGITLNGFIEVFK